VRRNPETAEVLLVKGEDWPLGHKPRLRGKGFEPLRLASTELETVSLTTRTSSLFESINPESEEYVQDVGFEPTRFSTPRTCYPYNLNVAP